jgi:hypothetical protein
MWLFFSFIFELSEGGTLYDILHDPRIPTVEWKHIRRFSIGIARGFFFEYVCYLLMC